MDKDTCKKVVSMLSLYVENKLDIEEKIFVENHFLVCSDCYKKYLEMKEIINNLHFEYEKLLSEFDRIESNNMFNIREYEMFYKNISPYIDDELCYDDSIKFRKYLLKSKPARAELANAYELKNSIRTSVKSFKDNININFSKKIIKQLQTERHDTFDNMYKCATLVLGVMLGLLLFFSLYMGFSFINESFAKNPDSKVVETIEVPNEGDMLEFTFDDDGEALLTAK